MAADNAGRSCDRCKWYQQFHHELGNEKGYCRYRPPRVVGNSTVWPVVRPAEWCGKFEKISQTEGWL